MQPGRGGRPFGLARELTAELAFRGQGRPSLRTKHDLIRMYDEGRIGWKADAVNTYILVLHLHKLQTEMRNMISALTGKRQVPPTVPTFNELFSLPAAPLADGELRGFAEFEQQVMGAE